MTETVKPELTGTIIANTQNLSGSFLQHVSMAFLLCEGHILQAYDFHLICKALESSLKKLPLKLQCFTVFCASILLRFTLFALDNKSAAHPQGKGSITN